MIAEGPTKGRRLAVDHVGAVAPAAEHDGDLGVDGRIGAAHELDARDPALCGDADIDVGREFHVRAHEGGRQIDHIGILVGIDQQQGPAHLGVQHGFSQFLLVSAIGANPVAANFYLQLKGCIEEDITALPFESIHIFRPSLLLGNRQEFRLGERIAQVIVKATSFLLIGAWRKYKPIQAADVAKSMVAAANREIAGVHMYEYDEMKTLIG